jgi:RND family efflux transporter MFP subunit
MRGLLLVLLISLSGHAAAELATVPAQRVTVADEYRYDGLLEAVHESTVSAEITARIEALPFDVDDFVERGQIIVRFRDQQAQADLDQAQAAAAEAEARLEEATANHDRIQTLFEQDRVSRADMDGAIATSRASEARRDAALAVLAGAEERFENTVVRAPYSGIVKARHVAVGEMASVGQPLMTGLSLEHLRVVTDVPQSAIQALREYRSATVEFPDGSTIVSDVLRIFPYAEPTTHTFRVRVTLPEGSHGVFPGMLVKVRFLAGQTTELQVPLTAVVRRSEVTAVRVVTDDGRISLRQVLLGRVRGARVAVLAGLSEGERVLVDATADFGGEDGARD